MLRTYLVLLICQAAGDIIHQLAGLPLSGPLIGMVLLLVVLTIRGGASEEFRRSGQATLGYLSLFFVPPGVGIMEHLALIRAQWLTMLLAVIISTVLAMISGAIVMQSVNRLHRRSRARVLLGASVDKGEAANECPHRHRGCPVP
ncbi:MAG TPA: CidA/LrgA family protein [Stellaceae bacterium]|nr:CidA/LrgA family protein [Stellaceae bacterium]